MTLTDYDATKHYQQHQDGYGIHHTDCGGQVMIESEISVLCDLGVSGRGIEHTSYKFTGYKGHCLKCNADGIFHGPKYKAPRKNRKH